MRPIHFGKSKSPLFGIHHAPIALPAGSSPLGAAPAGAAPSRPGAVLLCNPFGQEAIRAHRIYAVLAQKLSRLGNHVLRFDYTGTGDSSGEVEEGNQAQWIDDVLEAHEELTATAEVNRVSWVGLRYGATLAVLAAEKVPRALADVVLWDPVVSGAAYVNELVEMHAAFMREDLQGWKPGADAGSETLGFPLDANLRGAMAELDLAAAPRRPKTRQLTVIASRQAPELDRFKQALAGWNVPSRWDAITSSSPWNSEEAMNAALVPMDVLDAIVARVQS
jgi:pimeloyl-ACP methyl ester carboxylesterase